MIFINKLGDNYILVYEMIINNLKIYSSEYEQFYTGVQKKGTCAQKNDTPQKSYLFNIKLYDFHLKIIHFIFNFLNKYLVVV